MCVWMCVCVCVCVWVGVGGGGWVCMHECVHLCACSYNEIHQGLGFPLISKVKFLITRFSISVFQAPPP